jgi:mRNA-degrading endonuclease RelE of RelBE toxin-antitoxin system
MGGLDKPVALRVKLAVERFAAIGVGDVKRLKGTKPPEFRLRVGAYRVRFQSAPGVILILRVLHRSEAYR